VEGICLVPFRKQFGGRLDRTIAIRTPNLNQILPSDIVHRIECQPSPTATWSNTPCRCISRAEDIGRGQNISIWCIPDDMDPNNASDIESHRCDGLSLPVSTRHRMGTMAEPSTIPFSTSPLCLWPS
jgi:hypothetical protein